MLYKNCDSMCYLLQHNETRELPEITVGTLRVESHFHPERMSSAQHMIAILRSAVHSHLVSPPAAVLVNC